MPIRRSMLISLTGGITPALIGAVGSGLMMAAGGSEPAIAVLAAWSILGYLTLTDLGLTRTAAKLASQDPAGASTHVAALWRLSIPLGLILGAVVASLALLVTPWMWLLIGLPLLAAMQFPVFGALEARGEFGAIAIQRTLNALFTYLVPALAVTVLNGSESATPIALGVISLGRIALFALLVARMKLSVSQAAYAVRTSRTDLRLVSWIGLSSVLGPLMLYADRLALGIANVPPDIWTFYVATSELVMKAYIIPSAVLSVVFPWLAQHASTRRLMVRRWFGYALPVAVLIAACVAAGLVLVAPAAWIERVTPVDPQTVRLLLGTLLAATVVNAGSQAFIAVLQAMGNHQFAAISQLALFLPFVLALLFAVGTGSAVIIAAVVAARVVVQALVLLGRVHLVLRRDA